MKIVKYLFIVFIFVNTAMFANEKNVLLIHSFSKGTNWTDKISEGVESVLGKYSYINLSTEYMDIEIHTNSKYSNLLLEFYKERFSKIDYDVLILVDNFAVKFIMEHKKELFKKEIPIVLCGLEKNYTKYIKLYKNQKINIVFEDLNYKKNFSLIEKSFPELNTIYFIHDVYYDSNIINPEKEQSIKNFKKKYNLVYENNIDLKKLAIKINKLSNNSVILIGNFSIDNNNKIISKYQKEVFFKKINKPIFIVSDEELNDYTIGGYLLSGFEQGKEASLLTLNLLKGKKSEDLPFITIPDTKPIFNYIALKRNKIPFSELPKNATILNQPKNFIDKHRKLVQSMLIILPVIIILLVILFFNVNLRKKLQKDLDIQNKFDLILLENVNKIVFWCNSKNEIVKCNKAFLKLVNKEEKDILGVNIEIFFPAPLLEKILLKSFLTLTEIEVFFKNDKNICWYQILQHDLKFDKNNFGTITIMQDITIEKENEKEKIRSEQFLIQQSKQAEVGEMITAIAHQWKLPLLEISTVVQKMLLRYQRKEIDENKIHSFVDTIMMYVVNMGEIIDDFRDFIKPSKKMTIFEIEKAINDSIKIIKMTLNYNHININFSNELDEKVYIIGYENEFKQTIINIINNSKDSIVEARNKKKECGNIKVLIRYFGLNKIEINIEDDGFGFNDESLEKVFEPFFTTKDKNEGDGFGLYMSKLILEDKMGGKITINKNNGGANISIFLSIYNTQKEIS